MSLISLTEYAKKNYRSPATARQMALRGGFSSAQKIGRDWLIDADEPWPDHRVKSGAYIGWHGNSPKKSYYIHYYADFSNTYNLYWADSPEMVSTLPAGAERISRDRAFSLCRSERERRKYNPSFSGYADRTILPAGYDGDIVTDPNYILRGYIWDRK